MVSSNSSGNSSRRGESFANQGDWSLIFSLHNSLGSGVLFLSLNQSVGIHTGVPDVNYSRMKEIAKFCKSHNS